MPWTNVPKVRSLNCNGDLLQYFRTGRGWTQQQFAERAGYTKRLIAKAEAGGGLHPDTIEVLAEALSTPQIPVYPEDLISSPKELAAAFLRAYAEDEYQLVAKCKRFLAEDMQGFFPGGVAAEPLSGLHKSIDEYDTFCHNFFDVFERPDKKLALSTAVIAAEGNQAFIRCFESITSPVVECCGRPENIMLHLVFSKGKLTGIQHIFDPRVLCQVVTMWRERRRGILTDYEERHSLPIEFGNIEPTQSSTH